jgi:DNA-binding NarL/FixJ family response regulator
MSIRVLLADDHEVVRAGIRTRLERAVGIEVVAEAKDGEEALRLIEKLSPDVALLDCRLPALEGWQVAARARDQGLPTRVVALSAFKEDRDIDGMLHAGARGYLLKDEALETVERAVREVARGEEWYSPQVMRVVASRARGDAGRPPVADLTPREREVLVLLGKGLKNGQIAEALCLTVQTVKNHVSRIYDKLDVDSRVEAAMVAVQLGLVSVAAMAHPLPEQVPAETHAAAAQLPDRGRKLVDR